MPKTTANGSSSRGYCLADVVTTPKAPWLWLAGCLLVAALFGFRAAKKPTLESPVDRPTAAPAASVLRTKPIAEIAVGERVVAEAPEGLAWDGQFGEPEAAGMGVGVSPDNPMTARCHGATPAAT